MSLTDHLLYEHPFGKAERIIQAYKIMNNEMCELYKCYLIERVDSVPCYLECVDKETFEQYKKYHERYSLIKNS